MACTELLIESVSSTVLLVTPSLANPKPSTAIDEPTRTKKVESALTKLIRSKFQSDNE